MLQIKSNAQLHGKVALSLTIEENSVIIVLKNEQKITVFVSDAAKIGQKINAKLTAFTVYNAQGQFANLEDLKEGVIYGVGSAEHGQKAKFGITIDQYTVDIHWYLHDAEYAVVLAKVE